MPKTAIFGGSGGKLKLKKVVCHIAPDLGKLLDKIFMNFKNTTFKTA